MAKQKYKSIVNHMLKEQQFFEVAVEEVPAVQLKVVGFFIFKVGLGEKEEKQCRGKALFLKIKQQTQVENYVPCTTFLRNTHSGMF